MSPTPTSQATGDSNLAAIQEAAIEVVRRDLLTPKDDSQEPVAHVREKPLNVLPVSRPLKLTFNSLYSQLALTFVFMCAIPTFRVAELSFGAVGLLWFLWLVQVAFVEHMRRGESWPLPAYLTLMFLQCAFHFMTLTVGMSGGVLSLIVALAYIALSGSVAYGLIHPSMTAWRSGVSSLAAKDPSVLLWSGLRRRRIAGLWVFTAAMGAIWQGLAFLSAETVFPSTVIIPLCIALLLLLPASARRGMGGTGHS